MIQVLERGEKIELLVDKSENLRSEVSPNKTHDWKFGTMSGTCFIYSLVIYISVFIQAQDFRVQGTKMKSKMWLQNMKMKLIVLAIVGIIILVIVLSICHGKCD